MKYFKNLDNKYITALSTCFGQIEITEEEYNNILAIIKVIPVAPSGFDYLLRADTFEWELVELPPDPPDPDPELSDEETLTILLGVE